MSTGSISSAVRSACAHTTHGDQYTETAGNRAYQDGRWKIVTNHRFGRPFDDTEWQLYDLGADPTETRDVTAEHPEVVADLARRWERAAWRNRVFPLDDHGPASALRRPGDDHFAHPVTLFPGTPTLERHRSAQLIQHRDVAVEIGVRVAAGDAGALVAHGDQGGGYLVAIGADDDGELAACMAVNAYGEMIAASDCRSRRW